MTQPNDTLRKVLTTKLRKGYLLIIGVVMVIALGFTFQDGIGSLFKGELTPGQPIPNYNFPPTKVKTTPIDGATGVSITAGNATVEFDEENLVLNTTPKQDATVKKDLDATDLSTTDMTYDGPSKTLKIPYAGLAYSTKYNIVVPKLTIKTSQGEFLEEDIKWSFTTVQEPQNQNACPTENDVRNTYSQICKNHLWVTCDATQNGQKSSDQLLVCQSINNVWSWTAPPPPPPNNGNNGNQGNTSLDSCTTENQTKNSNSYICKNSFWLRCSSTTEGQKSTDNTKICTDSEWVPVQTATNSNIKISKASVFPIGFNPLLTETKITYKISAKAKMEIKIINGSGVKVRGLITDETIDAGEYNVTWDGAGDEGDVVDPGEYSFKITAKNPTSGEIADVKSGTVNVVYARAAADFETPNTANNGSTITTPQSPATVQPLQPSQLEANATMALQNAQSGTTAPTGPGVLIYLVFPVLGYFLGRKR